MVINIAKIKEIVLSDLTQVCTLLFSQSMRFNRYHLLSY